jgi:CRP-like cAMP-binding protein
MNAGHFELLIDRLRTKAHLTEIQALGKGDYLWREGETSKFGMAFLVKGRIKALKNNEFACSQIVLGVLGPGAVIGLPFDENGRPKPTTLQAIEDCELVLMSEGAFERIIMEHPQLAIALLCHIHRNVGQNLADITDRMSRFF